MLLKLCSVLCTGFQKREGNYTVNEGPVRIQYKCLVSMYVFPDMTLLFPKQNYNVLSPSSYTDVYL
jgi:hypothetical protein